MKKKAIPPQKKTLAPEPKLENRLLSQIRRLTQTVIVSGALNIGLMAILIYSWSSDKISPSYYESKPADQSQKQLPLADERGNGEVIAEFKRFPLEQLVARLSNRTLVENGFTQRDLALASLLKFHYFDLNNALRGQPYTSQKRALRYKDHQTKTIESLTMYPQLSEKQFEAIIHFANTERWPLTSQGLFAMLQNPDLSYEPTLMEAFYLTPEFSSVELLFSRADISIQKQELLEVVKSGAWQIISDFSEQQRIAQDLSPARRQRFLLDYIGQHSKPAALLILKTDSLFATKKLDDTSVLSMLVVLNEKTPDAQKFALELLTSPRSDSIWKAAAIRLYEFAGEPFPEHYTHDQALRRFTATQVKNSESLYATASVEQAPSRVLKDIAISKEITKPKQEKVTKETLKKERSYVVQDGDSLWKISRRYKIDLDQLKHLNKLDSDFLKPGTALKIPPGLE